MVEDDKPILIINMHGVDGTHLARRLPPASNRGDMPSVRIENPDIRAPSVMDVNVTVRVGTDPFGERESEFGGCVFVVTDGQPLNKRKPKL